jgi:hypothetical protein
MIPIPPGIEWKVWGPNQQHLPLVFFQSTLLSLCAGCKKSCRAHDYICAVSQSNPTSVACPEPTSHHPTADLQDTCIHSESLSRTTFLCPCQRHIGSRMQYSRTRRISGQIFRYLDTLWQFPCNITHNLYLSTRRIRLGLPIAGARVDLINT